MKQKEFKLYPKYIEATPPIIDKGAKSTLNDSFLSTAYPKYIPPTRANERLAASAISERLFVKSRE